ncbi:MAG TPA: MraY family glycosyltransferase [Hanamia sp.]|nr:MraY family glycosyltransferase [Hanamia sp.]
MENIIFSSGLAFLITFFSIPVIIEVAKDKKLFDVPGERKVHNVVIPTLGGLGIFAGFIFATLIGVPPSEVSVLQYFMAAIMIIFFMGIKDDILILTATKKFVGQLIAAGIIIKFGGVEIKDLYGILGIHALPPTASFLISLFTIVVITNSFNLIDGVDGLAGSLGLLTSLVFGIYFYYSGQTLYSIMALSLAGSLLGFLIYNFNPARIFMGDTGSLLIGLINSILVIKFINVASDPTSAIPLNSAPAIGFAILIVPLFDTLRVVSLRIINRRSPFWPDRNHIHHFLLDIGFNHKTIAITCVVVNALFIAMAYFIRFSGTPVVMLALALTSALMVSIVYYKKPKRKIIVTKGQLDEEAIITSHKIFTLTGETIAQD